MCISFSLDTVLYISLSISILMALRYKAYGVKIEVTHLQSISCVGTKDRLPQNVLLWHTILKSYLKKKSYLRDSLRKKDTKTLLCPLKSNI